jgi:1-acyl-sn-glycerol-3-phosphate acyltransferase
MAVGRDTLINGITTFLKDHDPSRLAEIRDSLWREIDGAGPQAMARLNERLGDSGGDWTYCPHDPLARRIHHVLADSLLHGGSSVVGLEHIARLAEHPVVIFANHLSYSDANLLEILLQRFGGSALADRLTVIAGPKVYSSLKRRFSSLCFGTIKTPQSSALSSEDAVMNPREVARAARLSIDIAHERLEKGDALLVFGEGTRSRSSGMQHLLPGVSRYLEGPGTWVLAAGITGTEELFPVGDDALHSVPICVRFGRPFPAHLLHERASGDRKLMIDSVGLAIAGMLPTEYRGAYADDAADLDGARLLLKRLFKE